MPADTTALAERTPLVAVHGICGDHTTWDSFTTYFNDTQQSGGLSLEFKLYYFEYPAGGVPPLCFGQGDFTPTRPRNLALQLRTLLRNEGIDDQKQIVILAHSWGGLVARSFMQEVSQHTRTRALITLATPHHGTLNADEDDSISVALLLNPLLMTLYWDRYDGLVTEPSGDLANDWLRCLNGIASDNNVCLGGDMLTRSRTFPKIVAVGLSGDPVDSNFVNTTGDELVPYGSALLHSTAPPLPDVDLRRRYSGSGATICPGSFFLHQAIHEPGCVVSDIEKGGSKDVFDVVRDELLATQPDSVSPSSGSSASQIFSARIFAPRPEDLSWLSVGFNASPAAGNGCFILYDTTGRLLYLVDDAGRGVLGPVTLGAVASLANRQCSIDAGISSEGIEQNHFILNLAVTFLPAFAGEKEIYMIAVSTSGVGSGWASYGSYSVP